MTTEVIDEMRQFQLFVPFEKQHSLEELDLSKSYAENADGTLTIEGIASTTNKDLQGDIILPSAIRSMKKQLLTTSKNLHGDHLYGLNGIYGAIKEVLDSSDDSLKIRAQLRKSKSPEIKEMLDIGVNLGLSIGGKITEYTILEDHGWEIKDLRLMEISLTGMPANWDTYGTIQESTEKSIVKANCLAGACHVIRKNIGEIMTKNDEIQKEDEISETFTKEDAEDLFNELMANKQDEIVREIASETVKQVTSEIPSLVKAEFEKLKDSSNNDDGEDETNEENDEETEDKEKQLTDLINKTVKTSVEESMGKLFKDLNDKRNPEFHVDDVKEKDLQDEDQNDEELEKGYTSQEIAKRMFANQSQEEFLKSLL